MAVLADIATVKQYIDPGIKAQAQRAYQFIRENKQARVRLASSTIEGAVGGALIGAAAGALVGVPFGASPVFAKGGSAIGAAIGIGLSVRYEILHYKRSNIYSEWLQKATAEKVYPIFQKYLRDEHLEEFLCPLTSSLIQTPLKDPHGCIFEAANVERAFDLAPLNDDGIKTVNCFNAKGNNAEGAKGIHVLNFEDFAYDPTYHPRLMAVLLPKFLQANQDPAVLAGLKAIRAHIIEERSNLLSASIDNQIKEAVSGSISKETLLKKVSDQFEKWKIA